MTLHPEADQSFRSASHVAWQQVDGDAVLVDLESGRSIGLNPVGTLIWTLISASVTPQQIVLRMVETFDVGSDEAASDLRSFLAELQSRGLIEPNARS